MAMGSSDDIFLAIRTHVNQTLQMAEAQSKIAEETRDLLGQLLLTRRGNGDVVLDMSALQRLKATENQWMDKERSQQDRFVNPTRLPQLVPGLQGLSPTQYLSFVQRPLERNGDNAPFLEAQTMRLFDQYSAREMAAERNKLFGRSQRFIAKNLLNALLADEHGTQDADELDKLRNATAPQEQFEMASRALAMSTTQVMNRLFQYGIALYAIENIQARAIQIKKAQTKFENILRKLASDNTGPTAKNRIKEIFLGFQNDLKQMSQEIAQLNLFLKQLSSKMHKDVYCENFSEFHRIGARLDALVSRWIIIMNEASCNNAVSSVEKIKGMHTVYSH